jgi:hypothetical protein
VVIPNTLPKSVTTIDDSAFLVCLNETIEETESYLIGNLTPRAHNVTGTVYLISDRIIEIQVSELILLTYADECVALLTTYNFYCCYFRDLHTMERPLTHTFTWTLR